MALTPEQTAQLAAQWGMPADQFLAAIKPYLGTGTSWSDPNGAGPQLKLANGQTWQPSGASSGIQYIPKGTMVGAVQGTAGGEGGDPVTDQPGVASTADQWIVSGDMSAMLGQPGSNQHTSVTYENVNGVMTPVSAPDNWTWQSPFAGVMPVLGMAALVLTGGALAGLADASSTAAVGASEMGLGGSLVSGSAYDSFMANAVAQGMAGTAATAGALAAAPAVAGATDAAGVVQAASTVATDTAAASTAAINEGVAPTAFNAAADSQAANVAGGLAPYSGSVPAGVNLGSAGGIAATGAAGGIAGAGGGTLPTLSQIQQGLSGVKTAAGLAGAAGLTGGAAPTGGAGGGLLDGILGGTNNAQLLGVLGSMYSGKNTADAISSAADKLTQGITDSKGQLLTSKTEALAALSNGLIDQKQALSAGLVDANGQLTSSSQAAIQALQGGADAAKGDLTAALSPYSDAGKAALSRLTAGVAPGGEFTGTFTMADAQNTPAMQFAQQQGSDIIQNSAAAKGGLLGTNTLADLTQFGQGNAAQYENQAYQQWLQNRQYNVGNVQSVAAAGQNAATTLGTGLANIDTSLGTNTANIDTSTGKQIATNDLNTAGNISNAIGGNSTNVANLETGYGTNMASLDQTGAQVLANSIIGGANAQSQGVENAIKAYGTLAGSGGAGAGATGAGGGGILNTIGSGINSLTGSSSGGTLPTTAPVVDTTPTGTVGGTDAPAYDPTAVPTDLGAFYG